MLSFMYFKHLHKFKKLSPYTWYFTNYFTLSMTFFWHLFNLLHAGLNCNFELQIEFHCINMVSLLVCIYFWPCWGIELILLLQNVLQWKDSYKCLLHMCKNFIMRKFLRIELLDCRPHVCILLLDFTKLFSEVVLSLTET